MEFRIPFSGRAHNYTDDEVSAATYAMRNAVPLTQGSFLHAFEKKFGDYVRRPYTFAVSNATAGLELSAQLCQLDVKDEVIIPAHTFTSTAYPFAKVGAKIVWADIDLLTRVVNVNTIINIKN